MATPKKTVLVKRTISEVIQGPDAEPRVRMIERLFLTGRQRPRGNHFPKKRPQQFWLDAATVAARIAAAMEGDVIHIAALQGGAASVCTASRSNATRLILGGSHRLATAIEIQEHDRAMIERRAAEHRQELDRAALEGI